MLSALIAPEVSLFLAFSVEKARGYIQYTYTDIRISIHTHMRTCTADPRTSWAWTAQAHLHADVSQQAPVLLQIAAWSPQVQRADCALICAILYRGLGHLRILVSASGPGTEPPQTLRDNLNWQGVKSFM